MEPRYHDGDILLVQECESVEFGELGIFILDGNGFFKVFGGDRLYSLNPEYGDILLKDFEDVRVAGRVIGKLRKR
jgi:phage repressor protein C with HTH and peptisase S24 domain